MVKAHTTKVVFPLALTEQEARSLLEGLGLGLWVDDPKHRALDLIGTHRFVPFKWACPGVYRLRVVDPASRFYGMEYVGKSKNVRKRVGGHLSSSDDSDAIWVGYSTGEDAPLRRHMEARALSLFPFGISDRDLRFVEHHWIDLLRPALNADTRPPRRHGRH